MSFEKCLDVVEKLDAAVGLEALREWGAAERASAGESPAALDFSLAILVGRYWVDICCSCERRFKLRQLTVS